MSSKKEERIDNLILFLKDKNGASIKELANAFDVSEMTIRRDLSKLKQRRIVNVVHGAAIYSGNDTKYDLDREHDKQAHEKYRIGQKAVSLLEPNDIIIIDTGTTTEYVARLLPENLPLTVLCFSANALVEIYRNPAINILFAGGQYHKDTQMFESPEGLDFIRRTRATKAFISAAGICKKYGVTCVNQYEVETKLATIDSAFTKILLADSTKFSAIKPSYFAQLSEFEMIITDKNISADWITHIQSLGLTLHIV